MSNFAQNFKELRLEKGIEQKDIALVFKVSKSTISAWEIGRNQPSYEMLKEIARYFDVTTDYLIGNGDEWGNVTISSGNVTGNNNVINSHNQIHSGNNTALSEEERELLRLWKKSSPDKRKAILELLK